MFMDSSPLNQTELAKRMGLMMGGKPDPTTAGFDPFPGVPGQDSGQMPPMPQQAPQMPMRDSGPALGSALMQHNAPPGQNGLDGDGVLWQGGTPIGVTPGRNNSAVWNRMDPSVDAARTDLAQAGAYGNPAMFDQIARAYGTR